MVWCGVMVLAGFLKVTGFAVGSRGTKVKSTFYFPTDPGYRDTVRIYERDADAAVADFLC